MDKSTDTGDPWDLPEQETPSPSGGINPLAESMGLFGRKQGARVESSDTLPDAALPEGMDDAVESDPDVDHSIESALLELEASDGFPAHDGATESVLGELDPDASEDAGGGDTFELIPPPPPDEVSPLYETYTPDLAAEASPSAEAEHDPTTPTIPPGPPDLGDDQYGDVPASFDEGEDPLTAAPEPPAYDTPDYEPPAIADEDDDPVPIEFGAPNVPEGSEQPTGKAAQTATSETMTRPALLTTDTVEGANIAPVDMVIAVAAVGSAHEVADAMEGVLSELRDRCTEAGADVVIGVKTEISSAGTSIMVTAAGTAVSLI